MSLWTSLEPASTSVDPGSTTTVRLRLRNTGDVVDEYHFTPVGEIAPYITVEPASIRLFPGTTGTVRLTFAPPRTPDATAGPNPYGVRIVPTEHPEAVTVPEGNLTITPFTEIRTELVPPTVKGRFRGRPKLAIDNLGNTKLTVSLSGSDNGDQLSYEIHPANVQIEPGRAVFVDALLKPKAITWFGPKEERPYQLGVQRSGTTRLDVEGMYVQRGVLPRWLATFLGVLLTLAIAFVGLWFAYKPKVATLAQPQSQSVAASALPAPAPPLPTEQPPTVSPPEPQAPVVEPAPPVEEKESDSGGGDGGGGAKAPAEPEEEKPAAPPENTAAIAVQKLQASEPGRHICYRTYLRDLGWQDPVCDGVVSGTEGQGKVVEGVNIAVAGVKGVSANGLIRKTDWEKDWKSAADGVDLYIGTVGDKELDLSGIGVGVGEGSVCVTPRLQDNGWYNMSCSTSEGDIRWIFGGDVSRQKWIEAVKFTV
ncbi:hydrolase [Streptomyces sp. NPDC087658]|uniref:hydrolase n=1 Tax=Streptomyces sp. NPDC087658 TaxID=3365800 RepID=UPI0037FAE5C9